MELRESNIRAFFNLIGLIAPKTGTAWGPAIPVALFYWLTGSALERRFMEKHRQFTRSN